MKTLVAKYLGTCQACRKTIEIGQVIKFFGRGRAEHKYCFAPNGETPIQDRRAPCWNCGNPDGKFRCYGAATPVYCDTCHNKQQTQIR